MYDHQPVVSQLTPEQLAAYSQYLQNMTTQWEITVDGCDDEEEHQVNWKEEGF